MSRRSCFSETDRTASCKFTHSLPRAIMGQSRGACTAALETIGSGLPRLGRDCLVASVSQTALAVETRPGTQRKLGHHPPTGQSWRSPIRRRLIATADGAATWPQHRDGDLNYLGKAVFSKSLGGHRDLAEGYKAFGVFLPCNRRCMPLRRQRPIPTAPRSRPRRASWSAAYALLDAFGYWRFNLGHPPSECGLESSRELG